MYLNYWELNIYGGLNLMVLKLEYAVALMFKGLC